MARADFAATRLPTGKALLIGGETSTSTDTPTVDMFDPVTNSITPVASMNVARNGHTATLLPNGRVLVVGGSGAPGGPGQATAEIYDPAANAWAMAASMSYGRVHHAAALMPSGKVIVVGGTDNATPIEVYDPGTNTWTSVALLGNDPRPYGPTATTLASGKVLMLGGSNWNAQTANGDVWLYDPAVGALVFEQASPYRSGVNWATATRLNSGRVLIAGGEDSTRPAGALSSTDLYDPATDRFSQGPPMNVGRCGHTATMLANGLVLVAGGRCGNQESISVCELYDATSNSWYAAGALQDPRGNYVAVLLPDGHVLAAGGIFPGGSISNNTELYTPA